MSTTINNKSCNKLIYVYEVSLLVAYSSTVLGSLTSNVFERRTSTDRKWAFFLCSFNMPWRHQICMAKCLSSYRDDLLKILFESRLKFAKSPLPVMCVVQKRRCLNSLFPLTNTYLAPCKVIQDSWDSAFHEVDPWFHPVDSGFQILGFRIIMLFQIT